LAGAINYAASRQGKQCCRDESRLSHALKIENSEANKKARVHGLFWFRNN
jgi:hypothetical protein